MIVYGMSRTLTAFEATVSPDGKFEAAMPLSLKKSTRAIITLLTDEEEVNLAAASETAWGKDWNNPDEDEAWASLQEAK